MVLSIRRKLETEVTTELTTKSRILVVGVISLAGIIFSAIMLSRLFKQSSSMPVLSHTYPIIHLMVTRFINGYFPYEPIQNWGYALYPNFMPFQWMPFIIMEIFPF